MTVYLDCNATTPVEPEVRDAVIRCMVEELGNAGSGAHEFAARAQEAVQRARELVASVAGATADEVTFTSGATESDNLALLGLAAHGEKVGRRHFVTTAIEHRAVLEPLAALAARGFEVTKVWPTAGGWVDPDALAAAVREDTLAVSVMHANNETGVVQPLAEIAKRLGVAAASAVREAGARAKACRAFRERALSALAPLEPTIHGDLARALPHVLDLSFAGVDSEALMLAWRGLVAVSNGAACTARGYTGSHVLRAMGVGEDSVRGAVRLSWSHRTTEPDWGRVVGAVRRLR